MSQPKDRQIACPSPDRAPRPARLARACAMLALALAASSCVNSRLNGLAQQLTSSGSKVGTSGPSGPSSSGDSFRISSVTIAVPAGQNNNNNGGQAAAGQTFVTSVLFDTSRMPTDPSGAQVPISNHCNTVTNAAQNPKPCVCIFTWPEINNFSGSSTPIMRSVQTPITLSQSSLITCNAPDVYNTEIPDGTTIKVTVAPTTGNGDNFTVSTYNFTKNTSSATGSFADAQGHVFDNIVRYSCYEQFKRGMTIMSKSVPETNQKTGEQLNAFLANSFCIATAKGGANQQQGCNNMPPPDFSAQAYYYNLFARESDSNINGWNDRYICPTVTESLVNSTTVGGRGNYWPMDKSFALMMNKTTDFNVGVVSNTRLANGQDPTTANSSCDAPANGGAAAGGGGQPATNTFVQSCLGFAAKPNPDGTCPYFRDSNGQIRFTYRLRRFIAIYPRLFDTDGSAIAEPQPSDTIYVLDRPVSNPLGDPLKPFTMRGPKPCPFAIFDNKGVLGTQDPLYSQTNGNAPGYGATNNSLWNNTNVDGIQLPNMDSANSCSAVISLAQYDPLNPSNAIVSLATVNKANPIWKQLYVRPVRAWAPHYEEDTAFQACAPQASPMQDPPLHFAKDPTTGNVSWCAESYPTQNDNATAIDANSTPGDVNSALIGHVIPFTSHVVKNSASAPCRFSPPTTLPAVNATRPPFYPAASKTAPYTTSCTPNASPQGVARHPTDMLIDSFMDKSVAGQIDYVCADRTCDRTVVVSPNATWQKFPLLARPGFVEQAISSDTTYGCVLTFDSNGPKTGKSTPSQGCCGGNVSVWTANNVPPGYQVAPANAPAPTTAHLEPDAPCLIPQY